MRTPFTGTPTNGNLRAATTYALYNGDVDASITSIQYNLADGGMHIEIATVEHITAPYLTNVVGGNYVQLSGAALLDVAFPALTEATDFLVLSSATLTQVSVPLLASASAAIFVTTNPLLLTFRLPALVTCPHIELIGNAFTQGTVDQILADLVATAWGNDSEVLKLEGGTNSYPSAQGVTDANTLIARGATVTYNAVP